MLKDLSIYQSGQRVVVSGSYEIVGADPRSSTWNIHFDLREGDIFPNHDGRAVCWHLLSADVKAPESPPASQYEDQVDYEAGLPG